MATGICLPVLKFSHATTSFRNEGSIPWQHVTSDELFVKIEGDGASAELNMHIIQRNDVLVCSCGDFICHSPLNFTQDSVDIGRLVDEAIAIRHHVLQACIPIEQLPIFGMTKDMLLAVRYRQHEGQV